MLFPETDFTINEVLEVIDKFNPVKIFYNNISIYNDLEGVGEDGPPLTVLKTKIDHILKTYDVFIYSFDIRITQGHHSVVYLYGYKLEKKGDKNDTTKIE